MVIRQYPLCNKGLVKMSSTDELVRWCETHIKKRQGFIGVFAADRLPKSDSIKIPMTCIINYDLAKMPGSHWVAASVQSSGVWWFDSYGLGPDAPDLLLGHRTSFRVWLSCICKRHGFKTYKFNSVDLQSPGEKTCGL